MPVLFVAVLALVYVGVLYLLITTATEARARARAVAELRVVQAPLPVGFSGPAIVCGPLFADGELLTSPLAKISCAYFSFVVTEYDTRWVSRRGKFQRKRIATVRVNDSASVPMTLGSGEGAVDVPVGGARLDLKTDEKQRVGFLRSADANLADTLKMKYGFDSTGLVFNKDLKVQETYLEPGDRMAILGSFSRGMSGAASTAYTAVEPQLWVTDRDPEHFAAVTAAQASSSTLWAALWVLAPVVAGAVAAFFVLGAR